MALLIAITITGCKDENLVFNDNFTISSPDVTFDGNTLSFGCERQTISIDVTTEANGGKWNAYCPSNDVWCSFSLRGGKMILTVALNNTSVIRSTWIEFVLGENKQRINVEQDYQRVLFFPRGNSITAAAAPHKETIPLVTNIAAANLSASVTAPAGCDWVTGLAVTPTALTFNILRNLSFTETRPVTITVSGEGLSASIVVTQKALSGYPYVIDLAAASFTGCHIYEIWDDVHNVKIGELCREYLHKKPEGSAVATVRMRAVVAYPMDNGKIDLTNGLVLQNGNFVSWNANITASTPPYEMLASYDEGETVTTMPTVIYFDQGATRMSTYDIDALPGDRVYATLKPYTLRDQRSGPANTAGNTTEDYTYSIVKVGTQYWIAENLRTSRFRDGENIPTNIANVDWGSTATTIITTPGCVGRSETGTSYLDANASGTAQTVRLATGLLYNYCAIVKQDAHPNVAMTNLKDMISPAGWKVPTRDQYAILCNYTSQTTLSAVYLPELQFGATSEFGNATGFSMRGNQQRGASGGWNSGNTHYGAMDYLFTSSYGTTYPQCQHAYYSFRLSEGGDVNISGTGTNTRGNNMYSIQAGHHLRLIRD